MSDSNETTSSKPQDSPDEPAANDGQHGAEPSEEKDVGSSETSAVDTNNQAAPEVKIADLQSELEDSDNRCLRLQAELENFRKRMHRDMEEERCYANLPLMRDMLSVLDNLQRAVQAAEQSRKSAGLSEGVKMVNDQFVSVLEQHGCSRIESIGAGFDPNLHEAVGQEASDEHPASSVTREIRLGYQLHDRVIRPSQVFVSTGPADPKAPNNSKKSDQNEKQTNKA